MFKYMPFSIVVGMLYMCVLFICVSHYDLLVNISKSHEYGIVVFMPNGLGRNLALVIAPKTHDGISMLQFCMPLLFS